jgi:hypothetical protein
MIKSIKENAYISHNFFKLKIHLNFINWKRYVHDLMKKRKDTIVSSASKVEISKYRIGL